MDDVSKKTLVSGASLLARGLLASQPDGFVLTHAGLAEARAIWERMPDDDKFLIIAMIKAMDQVVH
jgi:hypothetical protein